MSRTQFLKKAPILVALSLTVSAALAVHAQTAVSTEESAAQVSAELGEWGENVSLEFTDETMIIRSNGLPDHEILEVYPALSLVDNKTTYMIEAQEQMMLVEVPLNPELAEEPTSTEIGLIGIAISGGLFYSPFEADGTTVALDANFEVDGIPFVDACNGHPNPLAVQYHYHGVPTCITDVLDEEGEHSVLLGYLLDGFPVYGPQGEAGEEMTRETLDECNGHEGVTPEYPDGIYHYHLINEAPYSVPCYAGVIDLGDSPLELFTRGVDTSYPPPLPPAGALLPQLP